MGVETALIAATGLSAGSSFYQGYLGHQEGKYQQAQDNADATAAVEAGKVEASRIRRITQQRRASARAALAGSGVQADVGTGEDIQRQIVQEGEQDALTTILNGQNTGQRLRAEGSAASRFGRNALVGSAFSAAADVTQGYGRWKRMQEA
jgi:hypothetical protein